jgi:predicted HTH transcriptional regulator
VITDVYSHIIDDNRRKNAELLVKVLANPERAARAGSGVPNIFNTGDDEGWKEPVIEERFDPDRTVLTLEFVKKQAEKNKQSYGTNISVSYKTWGI